MRKSKVLSKLRNDEPVFCFANHYAVPDIVEMMGYMGVDVVWICNEHLEVNPEKVSEIARAGRAGDVDIMLRKAYSNHSDLIRPLEAGVSGLMIPHCKSAEMAKDIVSHIKFQPQGHRGIDGVNGDSFFGTMPTNEYCQKANDETFLVVQIEDVEALDEIEKIAATDGVDIIFVGPADLCQSMGIPNDFKNQKIKDVIKRVVAACESNGKWCGTPGFDAEYTKELLGMGVKFISVASDYGLLKKGFEDKLNELNDLRLSSVI